MAGIGGIMPSSDTLRRLIGDATPVLDVTKTRPPFGYQTEISLGRRNYQTTHHPDHIGLGRLLLTSFQTGETQLIQREDEHGINLCENVLLVGGPNSTELTQVALEFEESSNGYLRPEDRKERPLIPLKYWGISDARMINTKALAYWNTFGNVPWCEPVWGYKSRDSKTSFIPSLITDGHPILVKGKPSRRLLDNYVLITRLPNFFSPAFFLYKDYGLDRWPSLTVCSGANGIGTRSIELIHADIKAEAMSAIVTKNPYAYQLFFRVSDIKYDPQLSCDRAGKIELIDADGLPEEIDFEKAHRYVKRHLPQIGKLEAEYRKTYLGRS